MIYTQSRIFLAFFILGILTGFIFDFFRALRKSFKTSNFVTYIEDIIFLSIIGILFIRCIIKFSFGEFRLYIFIAVIFGLLFYILTIENLCAIIFKVILDLIKKIILFFIRLLKFPIKLLKMLYIKINQYKEYTNEKNNFF